MSLQVPYCEKCKIPMTLREKNGEKFFGCSNYKNCKTKTQPYHGGLDEPRPARFAITEEMWGKMELKLDYILDKLTTPEQRQMAYKTTEVLQPLKDILPKDTIDVKDIPF